MFWRFLRSGLIVISQSIPFLTPLDGSAVTLVTFSRKYFKMSTTGSSLPAEVCRLTL